MSEDRFINIESKLAHQDQLLHELNDVVTAQQTTIMRLDQLCRSLIERVRSMRDAMPPGEAGDERPPHY
jgi:SlyX protein